MKETYEIMMDKLGKEQGELFLSKLKKLKPKFDKLSYPDKLKSWEDNDFDLVYNTYYLEDSNDGFILPKIYERNEPQNQITILPQNKEEYQLYFNWYFGHRKTFKPLEFDLEKMKENYFNKIEENKQSIRYTQDQIEFHNKRFETNYKGKNQFSANPYQKGFNSYVKRIDIVFDFHDFTFQSLNFLLYGLIDAQFIPFLEDQLLILEEEKKKPKNKGKIQIEKIKWTGKPSQLGYIVSQLVEHSFIELPSTRGEGSYAGLAKLFYQYFDVRNEKGEPTTEQNLIKEFNPNKNTLADKSRARITIPEKKDI